MRYISIETDFEQEAIAYISAISTLKLDYLLKSNKPEITRYNFKKFDNRDECIASVALGETVAYLDSQERNKLVWENIAKIASEHNESPNFDPQVNFPLIRCIRSHVATLVGIGDVLPWGFIPHHLTYFGEDTIVADRDYAYHAEKISEFTGLPISWLEEGDNHVLNVNCKFVLAKPDTVPAYQAWSRWRGFRWDNDIPPVPLFTRYEDFTEDVSHNIDYPWVYGTHLYQDYYIKATVDLIQQMRKHKMNALSYLKEKYGGRI